MSLTLNLDDIHLQFRISEFHASHKECWDYEWCKVDFSVKSREWLNYRLENREILLCSEIELLLDNLTKMINNELIEQKHIERIEPDFEFILSPGDNGKSNYLEWKINFWDDTGALTANYLSLLLGEEDIVELIDYLKNLY